MRDKYEPPRTGRKHAIVTSEEQNTEKKPQWAELEIKGQIKSISPNLWNYTHLRVLYLNDNSLTRIPPEIARLQNLQYLDLSSNRLRGLPAEIGDMVELRELHLNNNILRQLPFELGKLFQLVKLGLKGNPLTPDILQIVDIQGTPKLLQHMLDNLRFDATHPPQRPWIPLSHPERNKPTALFTVMCYNVLCDKYCTRQQYGYCPSWALHWDYRKKGILEEIRHYNADIVCLQEVEGDQFYSFFNPEFEKDGYVGIFAPKSRAKTMQESEAKYVDGCAIFWKSSKFQILQHHTIEFNQLAIANAEGSENILNRVMTKDNIGLCALLETKEEIWDGMPPAGDLVKQPILVSTAHVIWDPEFCDVKLIQSLMMMSELKNFVERTQRNFRPGASKLDASNMPMILCGDLNSLPDSGVVEFLSNSKVSVGHLDFKEIDYEQVLNSFSHTKDNDYLTHAFSLKNAYDESIMEFTNYTYDFKGVIDYVFFTDNHMNPLGVLGPLDKEWFKENKVVGCPHPHIPSDHFSLLVEFELPAAGTNRSQPPPRR